MPRRKKKVRSPKQSHAKPLSQVQLDYLEALRRVYPERRKWRDACALVRTVDPKTGVEKPLSYCTVFAWRYRDGRPGRPGSPTFALREKKLLDELDEMLNHVRHRTTYRELAVEPPPEPEPPPLTDKQEVYLQTLRRTKSRTQAWEAAGLTWAEIKAEQRLSPAFCQACLDVDEEFRVALQDVHIQKGIDGNNVAAAAKALQEMKTQKPAAAPQEDLPEDRTKRAMELLAGMLMRYQPVRAVPEETN